MSLYFLTGFEKLSTKKQVSFLGFSLKCIENEQNKTILDRSQGQESYRTEQCISRI